MEKAEFISLVEEILEVSEGTISFSDALDAVDWDSLANISFIAEIDTRFGVSLDSERLADAKLVADLHSLLERALVSQ